MNTSVSPGDGDGLVQFIDPRKTMLTFDGAVPTPDFVDLNDWNIVDANGSARSPSVVESLSTSSSFSSYAGSSADSPSNDVGFRSQELEQSEFTAAHAHTVPSAAPGDTMHDIAATGHHGAFSAMPESTPLSANEVIALQNDFFETLDQMQLDMSLGQDFNFNTMPSTPNPQAIMMRSNENPSSET